MAVCKYAGEHLHARPKLCFEMRGDMKSAESQMASSNQPQGEEKQGPWEILCESLENIAFLQLRPTSWQQTADRFDKRNHTMGQAERTHLVRPKAA